MSKKNQEQKRWRGRNEPRYLKEAKVEKNARNHSQKLLGFDKDKFDKKTKRDKLLSGKYNG